ncbi:uncharacterized protein [Apostichopus japonicus]|uniref:uncharacterized protein n=1 Tax=Stichopus japonicus TaxID=307972 RepID=UPI003AB14AAC
MSEEANMQMHCDHEDTNSEMLEYDANITDQSSHLQNQLENQYLFPYAIHVLKLREVHKLPRTILDEVASEYNKLFVSNLLDIENAINTDLAAMGVNIKDCPNIQGVLKENKLRKAIEHMASENHQLHFCRQQLNMVDPLQICLGFEASGKKETFEYVSILGTLQSMLLNAEILAHVINGHSSRDPDIMMDYCDGAKFKCSRLFQIHSTAIQIHLYVDDFEVVNPLGTYTGTHKVNAMYMFIGNVEPKYRSSVNHIQLVWLCKSSLMKKYGLDTIIKPLMDDLNILEEHGIQVNVHGVEHKFYGSVCSVIADNLASHFIGGFTESFSGFRVCRFCMCTSESLRKNELHQSHMERTVNAHKIHVSRVRNDSEMSTAYDLGKENTLPVQGEMIKIGELSPEMTPFILKITGECDEAVQFLKPHLL